MSENNPNDPTNEPSYRDAKAHAKAAKAYAKAHRPWYKKKRFLIPGALLVVLVGAQSLNGGDDPAVASSEDTNAPAAADIPNTASGASIEPNDSPPVAEEDATPGLKTPVRDGKFEFTVKAFECGEKKIGSGFMAEKAQGQFCIATVKVNNVGDESQMFDGTSQYLYDDQGREFEASTEAAISLPASKSFLEDINPGNTVTGRVIWDVPATGFKADHLELHDSMFSGGVEVSLK